MRGLFKDFGTVTVNNLTLTDISKRVKILNTVKDNPTYYFNYDIRDYEKPEHLAQDFYGDVKYVWLIFLMNNIIDPLYDWILPADILDTFITDKYGAGNELNVKYYLLNNNVVPSTTPGATAVTNEDYEFRINESKRRIKIIKPEYADGIMSELRAALR